MRLILVLMLLAGVAFVMTGRDDGDDARGNKIVYRYLPRDLDTYIREDLNYPSMLYKTMFEDGDVIR
jgi:hypothetical protein